MSAETASASTRITSDRVLALCRLILAVTFWVALWLDPDQPLRHREIGYLLLASYVAYAVVLVFIAWRSWWWDRRLARLAYAIDVATYLGAMYFTEGATSSFTSPYLAFYMYLVLAATIRWGWKTAAVFGPLIAVLYMGNAALIRSEGVNVQLMVIARRTMYMVIVALVLVWFAANRGPPRVSRFTLALPPAAPRNKVMEACATYAATEFQAGCVAVLWNDPEEPWSEVVEWQRGASAHRQLGNGARANLLRGDCPDAPMLFFASKHRSLTIDAKDRLLLARRRIDCEFAADTGPDEALTFPFHSSGIDGRLLVSNIVGPGADDLRKGEIVRTEIESALDRHELATLHEREMISSVRNAIARDLHDSVAQSLAGAAFRLESLRGAYEAGRDPQAQITEIKDALRSEQQDVRQLIERLKEPSGEVETIELAEHFARFIPTLSASWGVQIDVLPPAVPIALDVRTAHELSQLLREAVANAVRHGRARRVEITIAERQGAIELRVRDNGSGFPEKQNFTPRSILERTRSLGGRLIVNSARCGVDLRVSFPAAGAAQ